MQSPSLEASTAAWIDAPEELARFTRWQGGNASIAESSLRIAGIHCAQCTATIAEALRRVPGVLDASVSAASRCATVRWDPAATKPSVLVTAIESVGYEAVPDTLAEARAQRRREWRQALWRLFVAGFCAMQVMMLATPSYVSDPGELALEHKRLLDWGSWLLTLPVLCFAAAPFFAGAWRAARQRRIGMDVPVALGIVVAFVASSGAAFDPGGAFGHEVYFDSLTMFVAFLLGGRLLELRMRQRAEIALEDATERLPQTVQLLREDGEVETVGLARVRPGDLLRVPLGQAFAVDGVIVDGATQADESLLTGEARPVARRAGDAVVAGSINIAAPVVVRAESVGADTRYEAIVALMRAARTERPTLLASADRWAGPFLWTVLLLALLASAAWSTHDPARAIWVAVSVLIVTCPCALSLAAPSALLAAAGAMGRNGVLLRRLDAIEGLARMQTLFIDKTGTLTETRLRCVGIACVGTIELGDDALRAQAAALAAWSTHPLAQALCDGVAPAAAVWRDIREEPGQGLEARDAQGRLWRLGSAAWVSSGDTFVPAAAAWVSAGDASVPAAAAWAGAVDTDVPAVAAWVCAVNTAAPSAASCWIARDGVALARFDFDERLRDDAQAAVAALRADGVRVELLSGDAPERAQRLAAMLGLDAARGALVPAGKLAAVRDAQRRGEIVAMLGDGINDAPVLAQADVSLAMGEGAQIARAQADGVLASNRLGDVVLARALARRTLRVVRQNLAWAALYNAACVPLALLGLLPPWAAGLGMAASSLFVVANSLRLVAPRASITTPWTSSTC